MMKKKILILWLLSVFINNYYSQQGVGNGIVTSPIASPSMSSMSTYFDIPVSLVSGIPEINIPLLNIPLNKGIGYPLSLSYNLNNLTESETAGDVGAGWSFFGTGVIYKKIVDGLDECYDMPAWPSHHNNEFDDVYYYNFPGASGKFRIKRDVVNNTFSLINLKPDDTKIEYVRDNTNTATFRAESFSITTDNGYKYIFNEFDYSQFSCMNYTPDAPMRFKSAYFLTKIISPLGVEIANIEYEKENKINNGIIIYQYCKLKSVTTSNGTVLLDYVYEDALKKTVNDPYSLQKITLKNPAGQIVYSYDFNYSIAPQPNKVSERKRILNFIRKNDKNGQKTEQTSFVYIGQKGFLNKVISPTGGTTEYTYEQNERFFDFNDPAYLDMIDRYGYNSELQYEVVKNTVPLNTEQNLTYHFTITGDANKDRKYKFLIYLDYISPDPIDGPGIPGDPNFPSFPIFPDNNIKFTLKRDNVIVKNPIKIDGYTYKIYDFTNYPGNYTLEITTTGGAKGAGEFSIIDRVFRPGPYRNSTIGTGFRIKNTKFYKNSTDTNPERTIHYEYDSFDQPNSASGELFYNEGDSNEYTHSSYIIYKNVKVSETGKGYIKNRFKTANDYPKYQTGGTPLYPVYFWPYYRITKQGLPFRKEIYDEQNNLLASEENEFELDYYSPDEYPVNTGNGQFFSKPGYVKKTVNKSIVYYKDGKKLESSSETQIEGNSFKPIYTRSIANGDLIEKFMTYPMNLSGYTHLQNAHIVSDPVQTIQKKNGKIMSTIQTKFDNNKLQPTSVIAINPNDNSIKTALKYDDYDQKGNLRQYTAIVNEMTGQGISTVMIWGYHETLPIAKIEGATLADIGALADDIILKSNADVDPSSETALINALDAFRSLPALRNAVITTYTYDPLIGVTTVTPPNGMRVIYKYDLNNRLKAVVDVNGNISEDYQYNTKPQP